MAETIRYSVHSVLRTSNAPGTALNLPAQFTSCPQLNVEAPGAMLGWRLGGLATTDVSFHPNTPREFHGLKRRLLRWQQRKTPVKRAVRPLCNIQKLISDRLFCYFSYDIFSLKGFHFYAFSLWLSVFQNYMYLRNSRCKNCRMTTI